MRKAKFFILIVIACGGVNSFSQRKPANLRAPVFSSVYSDISRGRACKTIEPEFIRCKPVGGYSLFASFHNVSEGVWIETLDGREVTKIPSDNRPGISRNAGKFEWRLANGKPFAIIARFEFFTMEDVEANRDLSPDRSKFAQIMVVKGLPGYERIDLEFDAREAPDSNRKARAAADEAFMKKIEKKTAGAESDASPRRLIEAQPDFTAAMSCLQYEKKLGHGDGETFKSAKKGDWYRHESKAYIDYFSPKAPPVRYLFKTKKFEPFTGDEENHLWFGAVESPALLARDETLKFESAGEEFVDLEIGGKTEKHKLIKIKVTGKTEAGGYFDKADAFLYVAPDLRNLVVKTELFFPDAGRICNLANVSFSAPPPALFNQFADYRRPPDKNQPLLKK